MSQSNLEALKQELINEVEILYREQAKAAKLQSEMQIKFHPVATALAAARSRVEKLQQKLEKKIKKQVAPSLVTEDEETTPAPEAKK